MHTQIFFHGYFSGDPRPTCQRNLTKDRIIFNSDTYEKTVKVKKFKYDLLGVGTGNTEEIFRGKFPSNTEFNLLLDDNYVDYQITNGTILDSTRSTIFAVSASSSNDVVISAKRKELKATPTEVNYNIPDEHYQEINYENTLNLNNASGWTSSFIVGGINYWVKKYNNGFIADIQFIYDSDMNEEIGYNIGVELYQNNIYKGVITELNIDVTGGMIAQAKILCDLDNYITDSVKITDESGNALLTENNENIKTEGV